MATTNRTRNTTTHNAFYGNLRLLRAMCPTCERFALIVGNCYACCDEPYTSTHTPKFSKSMCQADRRRTLPPKSEREKKLIEQEHRCFYCDRRFGRVFWRGNREYTLKIEWDHVVPHSYSANNSSSNFVAACNFCNRWKSNQMFPTVEAARDYLHGKWSASDLQVGKMPSRIHPETSLAGVLL